MGHSIIRSKTAESRLRFKTFAPRLRFGLFLLPYPNTDNETILLELASVLVTHYEDVIDLTDSTGSYRALSEILYEPETFNAWDGSTAFLYKSKTDAAVFSSLHVGLLSRKLPQLEIFSLAEQFDGSFVVDRI